MPKAVLSIDMHAPYDEEEPLGASEMLCYAWRLEADSLVAPHGKGLGEGAGGHDDCSVHPAHSKGVVGHADLHVA